MRSGKTDDPARFEFVPPLGLFPHPLYRIVYIRQDDRRILIPRTFYFFLQQILKLRHPGIMIIMSLHRVWVVSQQHGDVLHSYMLLQKSDDKTISEHVRLGPYALAIPVFENECRFDQRPQTA